MIPFGVPDDGKGLGLGLAALVHSFARIDGESVALAQLLSAKAEGDDADPPRSPEPRAVEAFVPPHAWRDLAGASPPSPGVDFVLTGIFEPPTDGRGLIQLLAFEANGGRTRAQVEAQVDDENAGQALLRAFDELWSQLGGELGGIREIGDLSWDALESVLHAERCALHDPHRGGPHDRLAAMMHFGRAIFDSPEARLPAVRLAALALEATTEGGDPKLAEAARRTIARATRDAPSSAALAEASAVLALRTGDVDEAERHIEDALRIGETRASLYALLSEVRRARGDLDGALAAIEEGLLHDAFDPLLNTERGVVLSRRGKFAEAERAWRTVLEGHPLYLPAFTNLASFVMERRDVDAGTRLVDDVLAYALVGAAHPEVLRHAVRLTLATEPDGTARAARIAKLAEALTLRAPNDAWASLVSARAHLKLGSEALARRRLSHVEAMAPRSRFAAEARSLRFAIEAPNASLEIEAVLRAAYRAPEADLEILAVRARRLASYHDVWHAYFALGIVERRLARWRSAGDAFAEAVRLAPGASSAYAELSGVCIALGDPRAALEHARTTCELEGDTARSLAVLATAFLAAGHREEAGAAVDRALALDATDEAHRALAARIRAEQSAPARGLSRLRGVFVRRRRS